MIDVVLALGFGRRGVYSGSIFVPALGDDQSAQIEKREIVFKRTTLPDHDYRIDAKQSTPHPTVAEETHHYLLRLETPATLESF